MVRSGVRKVYRAIMTAGDTGLSLLKASSTLIGSKPLKYQKRLAIASRWFQRMIRTWGIRVHVHGSPPPDDVHGIILANHLSYLDVIVLYAQRPLIFIAKAEIRSWPLIGWLARFARVIFVERDVPYRIHKHIQIARSVCEQGFWLCFFPEGKIGPGDRVRRFRRGLFFFIKELGLPIFPAVLVYPDTRLIWNEPVSLFKHVWRWGGEKHVDTHCIWLPPITPEMLHQMDPSEIVDYVHSAMVETYDRALQDVNTSS